MKFYDRILPSLIAVAIFIVAVILALLTLHYAPNWVPIRFMTRPNQHGLIYDILQLRIYYQSLALEPEYLKLYINIVIILTIAILTGYIARGRISKKWRKN